MSKHVSRLYCATLPVINCFLPVAQKIGDIIVGHAEYMFNTIIMLVQSFAVRVTLSHDIRFWYAV
jgi:hypothetical protein